MQEEWHCNERKCTSLILVRDLLLLDLDIVNDDRPSIAIALPSHIPWPSCCHRVINYHRPRAVHCRCCRHIAIAPSIAVAVAPFVAVAVVPSIAVITISPPLCHSLLSPYAFHCHCCQHPSITVAVALPSRRCVAVIAAAVNVAIANTTTARF